jgi:glycosyltransferase involved in cell wall biosynthesis
MASVDVIIPAFNAAKYLPKAIESVIAQTFEDWHIVLVDDGSTDDTAETVAPYRERLGTKMSYIRQENRGLPAARNAAIRASSAELLALLDADDIWLPCRLEESVKAMRERPEAGVAYGLITNIDTEGRVGSTWPGNTREVEGRIAPQIYMRTVELPCPTMTFRRRCVDEVGLFDETMRATEDRDLWLRIALKHEVAFIPKVLAYYRRSPDSMSANTDRMVQAQRRFIDKHYGAEGCGFRSRQVALARTYKQKADNLKNRGQAGAALRCSLYGVAMYPLSVDNFRTAGSLFLNWVGMGRKAGPSLRSG